MDDRDKRTIEANESEDEHLRMDRDWIVSKFLRLLEEGYLDDCVESMRSLCDERIVNIGGLVKGRRLDEDDGLPNMQDIIQNGTIGDYVEGWRKIAEIRNNRIKELKRGETTKNERKQSIMSNIEIANEVEAINALLMGGIAKKVDTVMGTAAERLRKYADLDKMVRVVLDEAVALRDSIPHDTPENERIYASLGKITLALGGIEEKLKLPDGCSSADEGSCEGGM